MDLTAKKAAFAVQMVALADEVLLVAQKMDELNAAYSLNHFNTGGVSVFTDSDFSVNNTQLSGSIVADVMFALGTVQAVLTAGVRNSLREALPSGLP